MLLNLFRKLKGQARWHYCDSAKGALDSKNRSCSTGQVMILTTLVLSGTILAGITVAGLLMLYQIRQSGNAVQSGRALYAADAGLEYELFRLYQGHDPADANCTYVLTDFKIKPLDLFPDMVLSGNDVLITSNAQAGKTTRSLIWTFLNFKNEAKCLTASSSTP